MREKRRSERVDYLGAGWLQHDNLYHPCRLENISSNGALVRLKKSSGQPVMLQDHRCRLIFRQDVDASPRELAARIAHCGSARVGLEFIDLDLAAKGMLTNIVISEQQLLNGARTSIELARALAKDRGIDLSDVHFDKGNLNPEREIHSLRFFAGKQSVMVDLNREEIEQFYLQGGTDSSLEKLRKAVDRLHGLLKG